MDKSSKMQQPKEPQSNDNAKRNESLLKNDSTEQPKRPTNVVEAVMQEYGLTEAQALEEMEAFGF